MCITASTCRFHQLKEEHEKLAVLQRPPSAAPTDDLPASDQEAPVQEVSREPLEDPKSVPTEREERGRSSSDEAAHKNRSKRESRRMRELEQAQFSLELLKVRTSSQGGAVQEDGQPEEQQRLSPRGSPASHGSFELLNVEDMETDGARPAEGLGDRNHGDQEPEESGEPGEPEEEGPRATFYISSDQSPLHQPKFDGPGRSEQERRESTSRRPVVVLISMQKESPVEDGELLAAQVLDGVPVAAAAAAPCQAHTTTTTTIAGLEVAPTAEPSPPTHTAAGVGAHGSARERPRRGPSQVDVQMVLQPKETPAAPAPGPAPSGLKDWKASRPAQEAPSPVLDTKPPKAQKKSSAQTVTVNMVEKPPSTMFSPPRRKLPFSK